METRTCSDCGKQIFPGDPFYQSNPMGLGVGPDRFFHSRCGDPFGIKRREVEIERLRDAERAALGIASAAAAENERLRAALKDAASCSNGECHGSHVARVALGDEQKADGK